MKDLSAELLLKNHFISKKRLACSFIPDLTPENALRLFRKWIYEDEELYNELKKENYKNTAHYFSPRQIEIIIKHMGSP